MKTILGAHSLSSMFTVKSYVGLKAIMEATARRGGKLFELPYLLCRLKWQAVAKAARQAGITELALCHFWTINKDGSSVCGNPLGDLAEVERALGTLDDIISAARVLREGGLTVRFIDGPTWGGLGWDYTSLRESEKLPRMLSFLKRAGDKCAKADLILAVEHLRNHEDKVTGGTVRMVGRLAILNHPSVRMHFDMFHAIENGEDPAEMIEVASQYIVYLHLHGDKRIAPGASGDKQDWKKIAEAVGKINSGISTIPVVPGPFGMATCRENSALGEGLPPVPPLGEYLDVAYKTFREAGLNIAD